MPVNRKTGKTDRRILNAEEIFQFRLKQLEDPKGKQPMRGRRARRAVSEMSIHHLTPEAGSPLTNSPAVTSQYLASASASPSGSPAPVTVADAPSPSAAIEPPTSPSPVSVSALVTGAQASAAPTDPSTLTLHVSDPLSPALAAELYTAGVAGSSRRAAPSLIHPIITPQQRHTTLVLLPPRRRSSRLRPSDAETSQAGASTDGDLESRVQTLERKMDVMERWKLDYEEWKEEDTRWKRRVEERLQGADM
jgi:hypothetical protein